MAQRRYDALDRLAGLGLQDRHGRTQAPDRNLALELVRVTEAAALAAGRWLGKGDKNGADGAAVDAMRIILNSVSMEGVVVIGEGEKDEAPMLFNGEEIGAGGPACDIAVDPIDGTTLTSLGRNNAISVIAIAERGTMFDPGPCVYMDKIAVGPEAADVIDIDAPIKANLEAVAKAKGEDVDDITAVVLDRPRHEDIIRQCREAGARIKLIQDGDVAAAITVATPGQRHRHPLRHRRHAGRCHRRRRAQVHGRRDVRSPVPAQRRRAAGRARRRLRPRPGAHQPTTSCRATTCSSAPPASATATCSRACATGATARARSRW